MGTNDYYEYFKSLTKAETIKNYGNKNKNV